MNPLVSFAALLILMANMGTVIVVMSYLTHVQAFVVLFVYCMLYIPVFKGMD